MVRAATAARSSATSKPSSAARQGVAKARSQRTKLCVAIASPCGGQKAHQIPAGDPEGRRHEGQGEDQARLAQLERDNARLRSLLGSARKIADDVIVAELLSVDQNPYRQLIEINRGSSDGVEIGYAVIDDFGIMGQVIHVNPQSATTILISDPEHAIPVQFVRSGTRSVAFGRGSTSQLELRYLPATADIMIDDELVTSGLGGRFPPDYPVARVTAINEDRVRGFVTVFAEPKARLDSSREVLVIKPRQQ